MCNECTGNTAAYVTQPVECTPTQCCDHEGMITKKAGVATLQEFDINAN